MKSGSVSFYLGIIALIGGIIATTMGHQGAFAFGVIFFAMGAVGRLFEHEIVDFLLLTFVGVGALVFALNFGQTHFGSHEKAHTTAHPATTGEHK